MDHTTGIYLHWLSSDQPCRNEGKWFRLEIHEVPTDELPAILSGQ